MTGNHTERAAGALAALTVALPLVGRLFGVPGRFWAVLAAVVLCGVWLRHRPGLPDRITLSVVGLWVLFGLAVVTSASPDQWAILLDPSGWPYAADNYVESKLTVFVLSFGPPIVAALIFALSRGSAALEAMLWTFAAVAAFGMARIALDADILVKTDYQTARPFYVGDDRGHYSNISMSLLLALGAIGFLPRLTRDRKHQIAGTVFIGLCLFFSFWLNLRAELIFTGTAILGFATIAALFHRQFRSIGFVASIGGAILLASTLGLLLHNEVNAEYWSDLGVASVNIRVEFLASILGGSDNYAAGSVISPGGGALWLGRGLGTYAVWYPDMLYPHNLILESYFELGTIGAALLILAIVIPVGAGSYSVLTGRIAPMPLALWLCGGVLLLNSMKSGDFTNAGHVAFFLIGSCASSELQMEKESLTSSRS